MPILYSKIEFFGYLIENGAIKPFHDKLKAIYNFPEPKSIKNVQQFLGLTGYFRKLIKSYSFIAKPLSDLLRHDNYFTFKEQQRIAFPQLKDALLSDPVLCIFKPYAKLKLHTDASKYGYGAILLQESEDGQYHLIYYMRKKTLPHEEKYSSYELEMLAVIEALKKFRHFLQGTQFKIFTDYAAFQQTINKKDTPKFARWAIFLSQFDYQIVHRPRNQMKHVDALSRHPVMNITYDEITAKIKNAQSNDECKTTIKQLVGSGKVNDFQIRNNILFKLVDGKELLVVPDSMQTEIIKRAHDKGHFAVVKTEQIITLDYYFPKFTSKVQNILANCVHCILVNRKRGKQEGFLNPIPKGSKMKTKDDERIIQLLNDENTERFMQEREEMSHDAKLNIQQVQDISKAQFDKKRKQPHIYIKKGELVAIKRTQFGTGLKLRPKFYGPHRIKTVKPHDRYEMEKVDQPEGPHLTSTADDFMKWFYYLEHFGFSFAVVSSLSGWPIVKWTALLQSPLSILLPGGFERKQGAMTPAGEAGEEIENAREADAQRQSNNNS
ncbi:transposon Tf2-9 polyprotein [Trichonephila clavipes]|nr:transposon Tf2-9 polyprotein [Trichonephila clavipes]